MNPNEWPDWSVYLRDRCRCVYCGFDGSVYANWRQLQIDHLLPKSVYPALIDSPENKVVSCCRCNGLKGNYDPSNGKGLVNRGPQIEDAASMIYRKGQSDHDGFVRMMIEIDCLSANAVQPGDATDRATPDR